jgi:uncharacterized protein YcfJ
LVTDPLRDYGIKYRRIRGTNTLVVKKIGKENPLQLEEGDIIELYSDQLQNEYGGPDAGTVINLNITRGSKKIIVPYEVTYKQGSKGHYMRMSREPNAAQEHLLELWLTN